jgi:enoyl-CoA hydratase/carnithine racemase
MSKNIKTSLKDGILTIHMDRPDKKNAMTTDMYSSMAKAISDAETDPDTRVIMIKGSKNSFCAGNDLGDFLNNPPTSNNSPVFKFLKTIAEAKLPLVAAVDGVAVGVGVTMLLHCDFVYMTKNSTLSLPFVNLGLVPEAGSSMLLPQLAGHQRASELLMLGEPFSPDVALDIGLVNEICTPDMLEKKALETAKKLREKPRDALIQTKALMRRDFETVTKRIDEEGKIFKKCLTSADAKEALTAFKENRKPKFS